MAWKLGAVALDCPDPLALAEFYGRLLGWRITHADEEFVSLKSPDGGTGLDFQRDPSYVPPTWPEPGVPQMLHPDFVVADLDEAEAHALAVGARATGLPEGPASTWRTYLDPAGHPFCLCLS